MNPDNTALVFVAIESIWPDTEGKDIGGLYDPSSLDTENGPSESGPKSTLRPYFQSGDDSPDAINRGYYLIMPLNVISASTSSNVSPAGTNNNFDVTFTLDDLILVTENNANHPFLGSSGFIAKANDLVPDVKNVQSNNDYMFFDYLRMSKGGSGTVSGADYVNYQALNKNGRLDGDSPLNLSRFRIKGGQSMFSIDDLVTPMDTVTIWIYHDPKEFMTPDTYNEKVVSVDGTGGFSALREFKHILGSGNRRRQFISDRANKYNRLLEDAGLTNTFAADAIKDAKSGKKLDTSTALDQAGVKRAAIGVVGSSLDYIPEGSNFKIGSPNIEYNEDDPANPKTYSSDYQGLHIYMSENLPSAKGTYKYDGESAGSLNVIGTDNPSSDAMFYFLKNIFENKQLQDIDLFSTNGSNAMKQSKIDQSKFLAGYNIFKKDITAISDKRLSEISSNSYVSAVGENYPASRKLLATDAHCETPYLAMKGHIKNVSSNWAPTGGYTVTLSGIGMEYPLDRNIPFYNDAIYNEDTNNNVRIDMTQNYSFISPPRMISHLVWRWLPNVMQIGPNNITTSGFNLYVNNSVKSTKDIVLSGYALASPMTNQDVTEAGPGNSSVQAMRFFSPINFVDLNRVSESARVYDRSSNGKSLDLTNVVSQVDSNSSVLTNLRKLASAGNIHEVWVDEAGKIRHRLTFEVWERTPSPKYTPTIENEDVISIRFTRSDDEVVTVQDVMPLNSNTSTTATVTSLARAFPRASTVPFDAALQSGTKLSQYSEGSVSPSMYRYGLRHNVIDDIFGAETESSKPKAYSLIRFFGSPIKKAEVTLRNNTSFRAGETVLVNLSKASHRSNVAINIEYMLGWLQAMKSDTKLRDMFLGVDERLLMLGAAKVNVKLEDVAVSSQKFTQNPKGLVNDAFIATLKWLKDMGFSNTITPEYFPTTLWYYLMNGAKAVFKSPGGTAVPGDVVIELHYLSIKLALQVGSKVDNDKIVAIYQKYPTAVYSLEFMNYVFRSYYIVGVNHSYDFGANCQTTLSLTHGQDNIAIRDPKSDIVLGFVSAERKLKENYPDPLEEEEVGPLWKKVYFNQWEEDKFYKESSFMYQAQTYRNASNYALRLAKKLNKGEF